MQELMEAVDLGNRDLSALTTTIEASRERGASAGELPDPPVMLGVSPFPIHTARGEQFLQLRVEQMMPWPGKRELQREMALLDTGVKEENLRRIRPGLILDALPSALVVQKTDRRKAGVPELVGRLCRFDAVTLSR